MKQRVEKYLPSAIKAVENNILEKDKVKSQFKGYISSFGAAIIQTGLIPAVAFYSVKAGAEEDRNKVIDAIWEILQQNEQASIDPNARNLLHFLVEQYREGKDLSAIKSKIMDATTALKLAVRTFQIEKEEKNSKNK